MARAVDEGPPLAVSYALTTEGKALFPRWRSIRLGAGAPRPDEA